MIITPTTPEIWKAHPVYTDYEGSSFGRVRSLRFGKERLLTRYKECRIVHNHSYYRYKVVFGVDRKRIAVSIHRFIADCFLNLQSNSKLEVDHIDGNPLNNHVLNLRITTHKGNTANRTQAKGYCWDRQRKRWHAYIHINKLKKHLGCFDTQEEAHAAYIEATVKNREELIASGDIIPNPYLEANTKQVAESYKPELVINWN